MENLLGAFRNAKEHMVARMLVLTTSAFKALLQSLSAKRGVLARLF
jgi:hypothetical protein